jgi:8-oxo-dGTP pyrophosphatase MutT (NUDIX family)
MNRLLLQCNQIELSAEEANLMPRWKGAAACCLNDQAQILMVLQGKPNEEKKWSVPSGGIEPGETPEECCVLAKSFSPLLRKT